jgi:hypothetical protein
MKTLNVFSNHTISPDKTTLSGTTKIWMDMPITAAYIPVKDMMANAPGFSSLYEAREIHFQEIYVDIIRRAFLPRLKGPSDEQKKHLLEIPQQAMKGKVITKKRNSI